MLLVGALAGPAMLTALDLTGRPVMLNGRLTGGARAGIDAQDWPLLAEGPQPLPAIAVPRTASLGRYAAVMGLDPQPWQGHEVLGVVGLGDQGTPHVEDAERDALAAEIARQILAADPDTDAALLAWRLPMIGIWAASRLRAQGAAMTGQGVVAPRPDDAVRVLTRAQPFTGYFGVERRVMTHALHDDGQSVPMTREAFVMGDAAVLLPWDPHRDRVLLIEQFRFAPAMRGDPQPWQLEPIAGRVDAGETPEAAIAREAQEEAGLALQRLIPAFNTYPSPGAVCEFLYHYVGIVDLPDGIAGIHGLASEAEDIRGHLMDRRHLSALVEAGQISNGPLLALSLWLDARVDRLVPPT